MSHFVMLLIPRFFKGLLNKENIPQTFIFKQQNGHQVKLQKTNKHERQGRVTGLLREADWFISKRLI